MRTVRLLATKGQGCFEEVEWTKPDITDREIEVKAVLTGICRSDIDMMNGEFGPLPLNMQGHEGLGQVTAIGARIDNVRVGDYVATRGEPAFADYYNVRRGEYVKVPKDSPEYILEPLACGINLIKQELDLFNGLGKDILIRGSGFLAWVAYKTIREYNFSHHIDVVGQSNQLVWHEEGVELKSKPAGEYDIVIDLKEDAALLDGVHIKNGGTLILGTVKKPAVTLTFENLLWKAVKIVMPSPRHANFDISMVSARFFADHNSENLNRFWTREYDRDTEWLKAFEDGRSRNQGYSRGYIRWR
jgi:D-arabinose 1-dehydrogenase-like Zn-dependent alcohol dehydrogenase